MATVGQIISLVEVLEDDYGYTVNEYGRSDIVLKNTGISVDDVEDDLFDIVDSYREYRDLDGDFTVSDYRKQVKIEFD